ncbi:ATP-binding protein [Streptomyces sp. CHD11]|uniref:AAA family ATPase n=1 Tax=Streptomyces sp. CHD11 TaxID=2741325 RepID=UPI001BFBF886|nr:AAA family ATPase [Streptomyces sp. CHD11]MBT3155399.1 ATP-binding protein [Streptomyces sp. CHD11]
MTGSETPVGETVPGPAVLAVAGRVERAVVVRRLLAVDRGEGGLSALHVRIAAGLAGVSERTVWRWLQHGREGRMEARRRQGGFTVGDPLWEVLTQLGGNVAELRRRMLRAQDEGVLQRWGVEVVPSLATLHRAIKDELRAGRVLQVARAASGLVEPSRYDRALAELGFAEGANGPPVVDGPDAEPSGTGGEQRPGAVKNASRTRVSGGVRLYAPGARLVSTRQVAGDTGLGKTVAVEQALHLLPGRVPVWRAVVGVGPGLPQVRAALCEALGLPSGSLTRRAGPADQALVEALAEPGVLFLDDAQRLSPPVLDYLRQLWDSPGCAAALVLCGAGCERALARAAAMRSRVLTWHQVSRLDAEDVPQTLGLFHPVWEDADPVDLVRADEQTARGNFRTWAKITSHVCAARGRDPGAGVDRGAIDQACARLGPYS